MRGRWRHGPEYEVVIPREEDLVRDERPLLTTEVRPPPSIPSLIPSLPETEPVPKVQTPTEGGALSGEQNEVITTGELEAPPVVSTCPSASASPSLERGQRTRQPPSYLKDFVCDCIQSGAYESLGRNRTGKLSSKCESCEAHGNINFCEGGVVGRIYALGQRVPTTCSKHAAWPFPTLTLPRADVFHKLPLKLTSATER